MFNKDIRIKEIRSKERYSQIEQELLKLKQAGKLKVEEVSKSNILGKKIYVCEKGNKKGKKILITSANHGGEEAGPLAALHIIRDLANPSDELEKVLKKTYFAVIPCIDPDGFDLRARKFIDAYGNAELWPIDPGRSWTDINGTWGRKEGLPEQVRLIRNYIDKFKPDLAFDLHETVPLWGEKEDILKNYGLLVLESLPYYEAVGRAIIKNIKNNYLNVFSSGLFKLAEEIDPLPQTKEKAEGRADLGPLITEFRKAMVVLSDYITQKFGIQAYTFETFYTTLDYRIASHIAGVEGGILAFLKMPLKKKLAGKKEKVKLSSGENFYLKCEEIAKAKLGDHGLRVYKPNKKGLFDFPKEVVYCWSREGKGELELREKFKAVEVTWLK